MKIETIYLSIDGKTVVPEEQGYYVIRRFFDGDTLVKETKGIKRSDSTG
ncbi:MAG: hypothetical protein ABF608_06995 [Sporolactobacillus sp.]